MSVILLLNCVSLCDTMKWMFFPDRTSGSEHRHRRRCVVDFYACILGIVFPATLLVIGCTNRVLVVVAAYLMAEMFVSTLKVQLVNTYDPDNRPHSPSRSVVLLLMGYATVILVFALFYKDSSSIVDSNETVIADSGDMAYFSLITIATVGYGDLHPKAGSAAIWLVSLEVAIGIIMIVVLLTRFLGLSIEAWDTNKGGAASKKGNSPSGGK